MEGGRADVAAFAESFLGQPLDDRTEADLFGATGCDGDDAFDFIEAFAERFGVDLEGYRWDFHHADEGALLNPGWPFRAPHQKVTRIPITLDLLRQSVCEGIWPLVYPPIDPVSSRPDVWNGLIALIVLALVGIATAGLVQLIM
ncbi:hypothetical protein DEA8626_02442 [Defluviimonas aquaemixtae]|uniref:DUF1493 family protein n=1 Tax=Albidovulum aquaemixtae TaxID=1542388 RepID=A0A2R8BJC3_9RHOB|nr:DUF1493 family protein [Defluviimonas aquaemixtae]SPH23378.1 hypothetical protein DEA8626_02442 [Defluviimonas aquaemixtae]